MFRAIDAVNKGRLQKCTPLALFCKVNFDIEHLPEHKFSAPNGMPNTGLSTYFRAERHAHALPV